MLLRLALVQCLPARLFPGRATVQAVPAGRAVLAPNGQRSSPDILRAAPGLQASRGKLDSTGFA